MSVAPTGETRVNTTNAGDQNDSSVAHLAGGGWVVTWTSGGDIYQQRYGADGNKILGETRVNATIAGSQAYSSVTGLAGGGWLVTWISNGDLYQRHYKADGSVGAETLVRDTALASEPSRYAVIGMEDGGWLVVWMDQDANQTGIYQKRYTKTGDAGAETPVNTTTDGSQGVPAVTRLANDGWLVTWQSNGDIYQRHYGPDGTVGDEVRVNTTGSGGSSRPSVTTLVDGGWVVTWESIDQDGDDYGIYQQRYAAGGAKVGGGTLVNTTTAESQYDASVTSLADGGWLVVWTSDRDGSEEGVYQQRYAANGAKVGEETLVNTTIADTQTKASVTALADGGGSLPGSRFRTAMTMASTSSALPLRARRSGLPRQPD